MWPRIFFSAYLALSVWDMVESKPFLYNGPRALTTLASSASASASSPSQPVTNIVDLRRRQQKAEALQQEKQLASEENDNAVFLEGDKDETNEAAPSIFQKKINKILTKIHLISSLSSAISGTGGSSNDSSNNSTGDNKDDDFTRELEDFDKEFENDVLNKNNTESTSTFQKVIYPHSDSSKPVKISLDINSKVANGKQSQVEDIEGEFDDMAETMGRINQIGVFFAELLGSVVGLVYGAAAQINNIAQRTTTTSII